MEVLSRPAPASLDPLAGAAGRRAFLAGVWGTGMRGLALLLLENGWEVWGSDRRPPGPAEEELLARGLRYLEPGAPPPPVSLAVRSAAVPPAEPGFHSAAAGGGRPLRYAEALGAISRLRPVLAVAGSHGKTTCTAWLAWALHRAGREWGWVVGGRAHQLPDTAGWGDPREPMVVESCEYDRSFHALAPAEVALLNVDAEHPDTYPGGLPEVLAAFRRFLAALPPGGRVFAGPEAPAGLAAGTRAAWMAAPPLAPEQVVGLPGAHNRANAALVAAALRAHDLDEGVVAGALAEFQGVARRLEVVGCFQDALVVSDYAHHPVEVAATLQAAREQWPERRLVAIFQPHQAARFRAYRERFAAALEGVDELLLLEVYRVRDPAGLEARVDELLPLLPARLRAAAVVADAAALRQQLAALAAAPAVFLFLGAGDVDGLARQLAALGA